MFILYAAKVDNDRKVFAVSKWLAATCSHAPNSGELLTNSVLFLLQSSHSSFLVSAQASGNGWESLWSEQGLSFWLSKDEFINSGKYAELYRYLSCAPTWKEFRTTSSSPTVTRKKGGQLNAVKSNPNPIPTVPAPTQSDYFIIEGI